MQTKIKAINIESIFAWWSLVSCLYFLMISASGKQFIGISVPSSSCIFSVAREIAKTVSDSEITQNILGFPDGSDYNESACNVQHLGLIPGLGISPEEWIGHPLHYSSNTITV